MKFVSNNNNSNKMCYNSMLAAVCRGSPRMFDRGRHSRVICDVTGCPAVAIIPNVKRFSAVKKVTHQGFLWGRKI